MNFVLRYSLFYPLLRSPTINHNNLIYQTNLKQIRIYYYFKIFLLTHIFQYPGLNQDQSQIKIQIKKKKCLNWYSREKILFRRPFKWNYENNKDTNDI